MHDRSWALPYHSYHPVSQPLEPDVPGSPGPVDALPPSDPDSSRPTSLTTMSGESVLDTVQILRVGLAFGARGHFGHT
jgi:hypothetical protein